MNPRERFHFLIDHAISVLNADPVEDETFKLVGPREAFDLAQIAAELGQLANSIGHKAGPILLDEGSGITVTSPDGSYLYADTVTYALDSQHKVAAKFKPFSKSDRQEMIANLRSWKLIAFDSASDDDFATVRWFTKYTDITDDDLRKSPPDQVRRKPRNGATVYHMADAKKKWDYKWTRAGKPD
jgi:hypothetical protein